MVVPVMPLGARVRSITGTLTREVGAVIGSLEIMLPELLPTWLNLPSPMASRPMGSMPLPRNTSVSVWLSISSARDNCGLPLGWLCENQIRAAPGMRTASATSVAG